MKKLVFFWWLFLSPALHAETDQKSSNWFQSACQRLQQIWHEGAMDLYLSGYAWHNRYTYDPERVKLYNEAAWGGGIGKGLFDEDGDWHGLFAIAFLESHRQLEPAAGYCFLKVANLSTDFKAGIGYSVLVTARPDIFNGIPFPGILPWASVFYKQVALSAAYIPGSFGAGNVLYVISRISF